MRPRTVLLLAATFTLSGACACDSGPVTSDDGGVEAAIDGDVTPETCAVCATQATCTLSSTVASCVCNAGYVGDGRASGTGCTDVDECGLGGVNDCVTVAQNGTCTNTAGGFTCGCDVGYSGDGTLAGTGCTDFDECMAAMGDACVAMANGGVCVNTDGTYGCGCEAGYVGDGTLAGTGCADIDECTLATDDCYADVCTNTVGAFTCTATTLPDGSHPITARLHASVSGFLGILSEFKFIGVGLTYQFVPSVMSKVTDSQPFEVLMYYKWRPFIRVEGGLLSGQTMVNAGLVHQQVVEDSMGLHGSGGVAYAINAKLEMTASAFTFYGLSPDINFLSFGVTFGVRYNLF